MASKKTVAVQTASNVESNVPAPKPNAVAEITASVKGAPALIAAIQKETGLKEDVILRRSIELGLAYIKRIINEPTAKPAA